MKDPQKELLLSVHSILDAAITYDGSFVPVYTVVPEDAAYPYIVIGSMESDDYGVKDSIVVETDLVIDVVTGASKRGSRAHVDDISNNLLQLLDDPDTLTMTSFEVVYVRLDLLNTNEEQTDIGRLLSKGVRIRIITEQT